MTLYISTDCAGNHHHTCSGDLGDVVCGCLCHTEDADSPTGEAFLATASDLAAPTVKPKRRRRSKDIGTEFTTGTIRYLHDNGFPRAELRNQAGSTDKGDIINCIGLAIECKGGHAAEHAHDKQVADWLVETETERVNAGADYGILIMKRAGYGRQRAGSWWCVMTAGTLVELGAVRGVAGYTMPLDFPVRMHLADAIRLIRAAGYGQPLDGPQQ